MTDHEFELARANLTRFVIGKAHRLARDLGFGYEEREVAPSCFEDIQAAYLLSMRTRAPFPIWNGACDNVIYTNREGNYAFRFWHDITHASLALATTLEDEVSVGEIQTQCVDNYFGQGSNEGKLMWADTVGQSQYCAEHGYFPEDQLKFVRERV
jgi:hypothetical protein